MPSLNTGNAILSNPIKVDSSYNVGIGGAASGSYKLQVTGTANFTSDVFGLTGFYTRNSADTFIGSTNNTSGIIVNGTTLVTKIVSGGNTVATFANAGAATFSSSVKVPSSSTGGLFEMGSGANANSRSFRLASDVNDWGDFGIQVSNSQTGTTYTNALLINRSGTLLVNATSSAYGAASGYNLGVKGTSGQAFISIARTGQSLDSQGMILGLDTAAGQLTMIDNLPLTFATNNAPRMTITSTGVVELNAADATYIRFSYLGTGKCFIGVAGATSDVISGAAAGDTVIRAQQKMLFSTGGDTERMRITSGGQVGINNSGASDRMLLVKGSTNDANAFAFTAQNLSAYLFQVRNDGLINLGTAAYSPYNYDTTGRTPILQSNGLFGYLSSTRESKTNIEQLSDISWLYQLNPVSFNYRKKDDEMNYTEEFNEEKWYGLIADEVEKVNEDLVFYNTKEDGTKQLAGVEYNKLIAALIKSSQEQKQQIEAQQQQINSLINR